MRMRYQWEGRRRFLEERLARTVRGCFAQDDQSVANAAGSVVRADINANLQALVTNSSGTAAPSTTWAYQFWADTTNGLMKQRNAANSAWITLWKLADNTLYPTAGAAATPGVAAGSDTDTGLYWPAANELAVACGGAEAARVTSSGLSVQGAVIGNNNTTNKITISGAATWNTVAAAKYGKWWFRDNTSGGQIEYFCDVGTASMTLIAGTIASAGWSVRVSGGNVQVQTTAGGQEIHYFVQQTRG